MLKINWIDKRVHKRVPLTALQSGQSCLVIPFLMTADKTLYLILYPVWESLIESNLSDLSVEQ